MKIHYSEMRYNEIGEAPFNGVVLQAKSRDSKHHSKAVTNLIKEILFSGCKGIIFKGDWAKQAMQFIEVLKVAQKHELEIVIYTDYDIEEFKVLIGQACYEKTNKVKLTNESIMINKAMLSLIGGMMVDYYITNDYYIICGTGDERHVCKIKKVIEDDTFFEEEVDNE